MSSRTTRPAVVTPSLEVGVWYEYWRPRNEQKIEELDLINEDEPKARQVARWQYETFLGDLRYFWCELEDACRRFGRVCARSNPTHAFEGAERFFRVFATNAYMAKERAWKACWSHSTRNPLLVGDGVGQKSAQEDTKDPRLSALLNAVLHSYGPFSNTRNNFVHEAVPGLRVCFVGRRPTPFEIDAALIWVEHGEREGGARVARARMRELRRAILAFRDREIPSMLELIACVGALAEALPFDPDDPLNEPSGPEADPEPIQVGIVDKRAVDDSWLIEASPAAHSHRKDRG